MCQKCRGRAEARTGVDCQKEKKWPKNVFFLCTDETEAERSGGERQRNKQRE